MTRDEAIAQLEGLQAERPSTRLYIPNRRPPELMIPRIGRSHRAYILWHEGRPAEERWEVLTAWSVYPSAILHRDETADFATLAECVEWLAGRE